MTEDGIVVSADLLRTGKNVTPSFPDLPEIHQIVSEWYLESSSNQSFCWWWGFVCICVCVYVRLCRRILRED